jgi:hypothetical protein
MPSKWQNILQKTSVERGENMTTLTKLSQILELKFATENWKFSEEQMNTIRKAFKEIVREWLTQKRQEREKNIKATTKGIDNAGLLVMKAHVTEINMLLEELNQS